MSDGPPGVHRRWIAALAVPLAAEAQRAGTPSRLSYLAGNSQGHPIEMEFVRALRELGWIEGRNIVTEARYVERQDLFPQAATELVGLGAFIVVWTSLATQAAKKATSTIPIVGLSIGDPVQTGLVSNLARPDGNLTGVANLRPALTGKWLELLREVVPGVTRVAILANRANLDAADYVREVAAASRSWKGESKFFNADGPRDFESAFAEMQKWRPGGLLVVPDLNFWIHRVAIVELAGRSRLPAVYWSRKYSEVGGLLSYAPSLIDMARRGAVFVDKILKGAKPADLPIEQPTKFELVINLQTAKALGLTIPPSLLLRADQVIE